MRDPQGEPSDLIRSVSRALRVLEAVGGSPRGLTVKQIARRCELTVATTYHLVRTLAYEGYVTRREDGTYVVGVEVSDRYRELAAAYRGPDGVADCLRCAAMETGYSYVVGRFVAGRVVLMVMASGPRSPHLDDLVAGFDDGAHATAFGKSLLATLTADQRARYLREHGMPAYTPNTLTTAEALETDLIAGERRGMHMEINQFRSGVGGAAILAIADRDMERRAAVACVLPATDLMASARTIRARLVALSRSVALAYGPRGHGAPLDGSPARPT